MISKAKTTLGVAQQRYKEVLTVQKKMRAHKPAWQEYATRAQKLEKVGLIDGAEFHRVLKLILRI